MFVLPPPPRYPTQQALTAAAASGQALPIIETNNVLGHPVGPEFQLLAGEGTYILKDDLHLATPPPHPSEALPVNPNPLATIMGPPGIGTRLSIISIIGKPPNTQVSKAESTSGTWPIAKKPHSIKESSREGRSSSESHSARLSSEVGTAHSNGQSQGLDESVPVFGDANALLAPATSSKETLKRRKPKNNIVKSNSSFVSRVIPHEAFTKRVQERSPEGTMAFANVNRAFQWIDLSSPTMADALTKILFTKAHALCHDVNQLTKSSTHLDVIMGFSTGDIIWYEPMSQKYARLNKNVVINSHPVSEIRWIPGSENLFLAAHMDGSLVVYDKEKEDAIFMPEDIEVPSNHSSTSEDTEPVLHVKKSVNSRNQRSNPVSYWKISNQRINGFSFSPDGKHLAVVSEDGSLRIIDYLKERLIDVYTSYYGGFMCVSWSPDGKYTITGGQDDLVSIWSLAESRIVARCQGHHSWVTAVAFDPWRCDERNYRFGSVGEDRRLLLWDFSVGMLHRPKAASVRHRGSVSSHAGLPNRPRTESSVTTASRSSAHHPVEPRARTAMLPPVLSKAADPDPLSWLGFEEDCIITACCNGHIRKWDRPKEGQDAGEPVLEVSSSAF